MFALLGCIVFMLAMAAAGMPVGQAYARMTVIGLMGTMATIGVAFFAIDWLRKQADS